MHNWSLLRAMLANPVIVVVVVVIINPVEDTSRLPVNLVSVSAHIAGFCLLWISCGVCVLVKLHGYLLTLYHSH